MNKENCALKLVEEITLYYDARSKKLQNIYKNIEMHLFCSYLYMNCIALFGNTIDLCLFLTEIVSLMSLEISAN